MTTGGGKRKKSQSESFGKKIKGKTPKGSKSNILRKGYPLAPPPPDDDDISSGESSLLTPEGSTSELQNMSISSGKNKNKKTIGFPGPDGKEESSPAFILIPITTGGDFGDDEDEDVPEISIEEAHNYPIGSTGKRKVLKLPPVRKKSPLTLKLEKAKNEIEHYNKETYSHDKRRLPIKDQVLLMETEVAVRANILRKFEDIEKSKSSYDVSKYTNWVKDVLRLPFGKTIPLPITIDDGPERIKDYLSTVKQQLNKAIAGQDVAKEEVVDFIARLVANPKSRGNILALTGGPGVGKTRLVRKGIAEALGRPFHVLNLGGMNDVHVLTGHDLTYTGAKYGRFAQILIQSQCENPVIYLDEIDKVQSGNDKGMEIFRVLTHVLDEEQNHEFYDEYFSNVSIDLSKILFVASLNNPDDIEGILRDRLKLIKVNDLTSIEKIEISKDYILPELCEQVAMPLSVLQMDDDIIRYVIRNKTEDEGGCRQLKRKWETIVQKVNTQRITKTGVFRSSEKIVLTEDIVNELLKNADYKATKFPQHLYN